MPTGRRLAFAAILAALVSAGVPAIGASPRGKGNADAPRVAVTWTSARFSADGAYLLTSDSISGLGRSRGTCLWNARTGEFVDAKRVRRAFVDDPVHTRDPTTWLIEWDEREQKLKWLRPARPEVPLEQASETRIVEAGIAGAGERLAYFLDERAIRAYSFASGEPRWSFDLEGIAFYQFPEAGPYIRVSTDGRYLVFREKIGTLYVIDAATGKATTIAVGDRPGTLSRQTWNHGALFSRDGERLYLGHSAGADVVSTGTWTVVARIHPGPTCPARRNQYMYPAAETREGAVIMLMDFGVTCTVDGRTATPLTSFDPTAAFEQRHEKHAGFLDHTRQTLSADGRRYALYNYMVDRITVWQPATGTLVSEVRTRDQGTVAHPDRRSIALTPDGQRLLVFDNLPTVTGTAMWDVATNRMLFELVVTSNLR